MFDGEDVLRREGNIRGAGIVAQVSNFPRPRIGTISSPLLITRKGNLRKGRVIAGGHLLKALKQQLVLRMVSASKRGRWRRKSSAAKTPDR